VSSSTTGVFPLRANGERVCGGSGWGVGRSGRVRWTVFGRTELAFTEGSLWGTNVTGKEKSFGTITRSSTRVVLWMGVGAERESLSSRMVRWNTRVCGATACP
jgi:hypothetical protein